MKTYYSPTKPQTRIYHPHLFFKVAFFAGRLVKRPKVLIESPLPAEPVLFMANHANDYGPTAVMLALKKRKFRSWSSANMLSLKTAPDQIMKTIFPNARGVLKPVCRVMSYLMAPVMASMFKAAGVVPVYRDIRIKTTYTKTIETLKEGLDVVIFPESIVPNPENPYLDTLQKGAFKTLGFCKKYLGSVPKIYPVYCCRSLDTVVIGAPVIFDESLPVADAEEKATDEINAAVKRLGESLPPHKVTHYAVLPKNIDNIRKYMTYNEEKIYEQLREYYIEHNAEN
ncbi:MAG: hypothetical protein LBT20_02270 [Clostridiales bacterium]|jgi:1-acyl-sn-glycerol-3-phosphate acyltransferase|nr:hypothetical protein [Clostridiales bacterium]